ncbi:hypothetical protein B0O99DRAFT_689376 [Bisporella sp. PMI_857]|nr:hypothetical protein B0O99DRAFT_689376 [Bisporella sp. PMI_857]
MTKSTPTSSLDTRLIQGKLKSRDMERPTPSFANSSPPNKHELISSQAPAGSQPFTSSNLATTPQFSGRKRIYLSDLSNKGHIHFSEENERMGGDTRRRDSEVSNSSKEGKKKRRRHSSAGFGSEDEGGIKCEGSIDLDAEMHAPTQRSDERRAKKKRKKEKKKRRFSTGLKFPEVKVEEGDSLNSPQRSLLVGSRDVETAVLYSPSESEEEPTPMTAGKRSKVILQSPSESEQEQEASSIFLSKEFEKLEPATIPVQDSTKKTSSFQVVIPSKKHAPTPTPAKKETPIPVPRSLINIVRESSARGPQTPIPVPKPLVGLIARNSSSASKPAQTPIPPPKTASSGTSLDVQEQSGRKITPIPAPRPIASILKSAGVTTSSKNQREAAPPQNAAMLGNERLKNVSSTKLIPGDVLRGIDMPGANAVEQSRTTVDQHGTPTLASASIPELEVDNISPLHESVNTEWEAGAGKIRGQARNDDLEIEENTAFAAKYIVPRPNGISLQGIRFRVIFIGPGKKHAFPHLSLGQNRDHGPGSQKSSSRATGDAVTVCSVAKGVAEVQLGDNERFAIGEHGMWRIREEACTVRNRGRDEVVLHATFIS